MFVQHSAFLNTAMFLMGNMLQAQALPQVPTGELTDNTGGGVVFSSTINLTVPYEPAAPAVNDPNIPRKYGMVLFPGFEPLDVFGPIDVFYTLSRTYRLELSLIAKDLTPVTSEIVAANRLNSSFYPAVSPTHTFAQPPQDLDVLLIPGGAGTRQSDEVLSELYNYVKSTYPNLKHLITVCTGAMIAAKAGVLDGRRATTNKLAWQTVVNAGPNVNWVSHARWVQDGNIWTSSGVSAGIDVAAAFVASTFGLPVARNTTNMMEYKWDPNPDLDPFAVLYNIPGGQ